MGRRGPIHWPYLWDEVMVPITYDSDWQKAARIILKQGQEYSVHFQAKAKAELQKAVGPYPALHEASVEPTLYTVMTDNWIEIMLRYVVDPRKRRTVNGKLHRELLQRFEKERDVTVASMTVEIVGFPPLADARSVQQGAIE